MAIAPLIARFSNRRGVYPVLFSLLSACAQQPTYSLLPTARGDAQYSTRYRIAPGDRVHIFVWRNPEVSTEVTVRPDGFLSAPFLEEIPTAGKTPAELARELEKG